MELQTSSQIVATLRDDPAHACPPKLQRRRKHRRILPQRRVRPNTRAQGQAMVEFVIILLVVFALCAGMLWTSRLLTFDFWAQQEARYLAFEQTWAAKSSYSDSVGEPVAKLDNGTYLHRPKLIDRLDENKNVSDEGNVSELIPLLSKLDGASSDAGLGNEATSPVMLAKSEPSIWTAKTSEWWKGARSRVSLIRSAFASEDLAKSRESHLTERREEPETVVVDSPKEKRRQAIQHILEKGGFGGKFCGRMNEVAAKYNVRQVTAHFSDTQCGPRYEREFSGYVADNVNIAEIYREFEYRIESGFETGDAIHDTIDNAVADQFYSFFDIFVRTSIAIGVPYLISERINYAILPADTSFTRMLSEMRYLGSAVAIATIDAAILQLAIADPTNRDYQVEKDAEKTLNELLHADASDVLGFSLNPTYIPVPPVFGPVFGGLQSGLMKNVLAKEPNKDQLVNDLIENSNKLTEVSYDATKGSFSAARRRYQTTGKILTARFFLVTQPWHIPRRESPFGVFRNKGDQFDDVDTETDEGILRRRVFGLWLIPSDISALLDPLSSIPELAPIFAPISTGLNLIEGPVTVIKDVIADNPLFKIFDALSNFPGFGSIVPTLPKWPAVRPDAYPGSTEMNGDKLTGKERNFQDYIKEQRDFNPEPNPEFND